MKRTLTIFLGAALIFGLALGTASAKTLVYCSEGSPEGFNPTVTVDSTAAVSALMTDTELSPLLVT